MSGITLPPPPSGSIDRDLYQYLYLVYQSIIGITSGGTGEFGDPGTTEAFKALVPDATLGLDQLGLEVADIGQIVLNGTAILSSANEINQLNNSHIVRSTLSGLQGFSNAIFSCSMGIGVESGNTINVAIQFYNAAGNFCSIPVGFQWWLSDSSSGQSFSATSPDTSVVASTGSLYEMKSGLVMFQGISDSTGAFSVNIKNTTIQNWYLVVQLPFGKLQVSSIISFV